jgi:hypothetical protein
MATTEDDAESIQGVDDNVSVMLNGAESKTELAFRLAELAMARVRANREDANRERPGDHEGECDDERESERDGECDGECDNECDSEWDDERDGERDRDRDRWAVDIQETGFNCSSGKVSGEHENRLFEPNERHAPLKISLFTVKMQ